MLWIDEKMAKDFEEVLWNPTQTNFVQTIENICDALAEIGYSIEIKKRI